VVGEINASCRRCTVCRAGRRSHCPQRTVLGIAGRHGVFADLVSLPAANLHLVPDAIPDQVAVFTEPLAAALEIQEQVAVAAEQRVLVIGDGKLGQLIARSLALTGCRLQVVGRHAIKLELLRLAGIATVAADDIEAGGYDLVVECAGKPEAFALARRAVRPAGTLVMKSTYAGRLEVDASGLVVDEIRLVGSRCGPFAPALALLASGRLDVTPLIAARYPLEQGLAAFQRAALPGTLKVLLEVAAAG
jgi:threonine dehydrogenase-like Zn-dependent dehydrogenase